MTLTTSKGETFTTHLTDAKAAEIILRGHPEPGFAEDLAMAQVHGRLTDRQRPWLHKLALERLQPKPTVEPVADVRLRGIVDLLRKAAEHLKYPKITLDQDEGRVRLQLAGPNSKYAGQVMITDGGSFGNNVWYGRITETGAFVPSRHAAQWLTDVLLAFAKAPADYAKRYGQQTGSCCFCNRTLETDESLAAGYGPVCAGRYGLPWGRPNERRAVTGGER